MTYRQNHLTHSIVMVRPIDFGYNEQTGEDNEFQHRPAGNESEIRKIARGEYEAMVDRLRQQKIEVIELQKDHTEQILPDAIFPNNWFSTRQDGTLLIYPMKTANRQAEVQQAPLLQALQKYGYHVQQIRDLRQSVSPNTALEGTGSLIFHHDSGSLFAAISERCERLALAQFASQQDYQLYPFDSKSSAGFPIYHTNVLMSCGEQFAVIAPQILLDNRESQTALKRLNELVEDVIEISEFQMREHFCGNIIQLANSQGEPCIVMSASAFKGFTGPQRTKLEKHGDLVVCEINTIEHIGGGSARCMIAENFLPQFSA